jgi:hypothetical protein
LILFLFFPEKWAAAWIWPLWLRIRPAQDSGKKFKKQPVQIKKNIL